MTNHALKLNWSRWNPYALGILVGVLLVIGWSAATSCASSPEVAAQATQLEGESLDLAASAKLAQAEAVKADKAAAGALVDKTVVDAQIGAAKLDPPTDPAGLAALAALEAKALDLAKKFDELAAKSAAERAKAEADAAASVEKLKQADAIIAADLAAQAKPVTGLVGSIGAALGMPAAGPMADWIAGGILGAPFVARLATGRGREGAKAVLGALLPHDGKIDLGGAAIALLRMYGLKHTTDDPLELAANAAFVARSKGLHALAATLEAAAAAQKAESAKPVVPLPLGASVPLPAAA